MVPREVTTHEEIIEIVEDEPEVAYATAGEPETKVVKKVVRKKAE